MSRPNSGHPEIGSIIRKRDIIHFCLYPESREDYKPLSAITGMMGLLYELEEKHRDNELIEALKREEGALEEIKDTSQRDKRFNAMRHKYRDWLKRLNDALWKGKYLDPGRYSPETKRDTTFKGTPWTDKDEEIEI